MTDDSKIKCNFAQNRLISMYNLFKTNYIKYILIVLIIWTFFPFLNQTFGVGDDIMYFNITQSNDIWDVGLDFAKKQGRFYHAFSTPIFAMYIPYFTENLLITSIFNLTLIAIGFVLISFFLKELFNKKEFFYILLVYLLATVNIDGHYNPIISYPVYFSISIIAILSSFILLIKYQKTNNKNLLYISSALYFLSLLFCELHVFYLLIILIINIKNPFKENFKNLHKNPSVIYISATVVYIIIYVSWRLIFNDETYKGSQIDPNISMLSFIKTVFTFSIPATPIYFFFTDKTLLMQNSFLVEGHTQNLLHVLIHSKIEWLIKALLLTIIFTISLKLISGIKNKTAVTVLVLSFTFIFIPNILISITSKYTEWGEWENYYCYTFYSFLSFSIFYSTIIVFVKDRIPNIIIKNIFIGTISFCIFIFSITTDYVNTHVKISIQKSERQLKTLNTFISTTEFNSLPNNAIIVAPDLFNRQSDNLYFCWEKPTIETYIKNKTNKKLDFYSSFNFLPEKKSSQMYYLKYSSNPKFDESYIVLSKTSLNNSEYLESDSVVLYINSPNKFFTVFFERDSSIIVNGKKIPSNEKIPFSFKNNNLKSNFITISIKSSKINLNSFILTSTIDSNPFNNNSKHNFIILN